MATILHAPASADPIHGAIERHRAACLAYHDAPSLSTNDDVDAATDALVSTACATRFGALALLTHLRWWLNEEAEFSDGHQPGYGLAQARAADLLLFLGTNLPPAVIPRAYPQGRLGPAAAIVASRRLLPGVARYHQNAPAALPNEPLPGEDETWGALSPVRPDTAFVRAGRLLSATGELLAALAIIGGGCLLTGLATLL